MAKKPAFPSVLPTKDKKEEPGQERDGLLDQDKHLRDHKLDSASPDRYCSGAAKQPKM